VRGSCVTADDRDAIMRGIAEGLSFREIASRLGRDHSVISREVARNGGRERYGVFAAQARADVMRARPKRYKLESDRRLHDVVADGLARDWSPQQIAGKLVEEYPDDPGMRVAHETIYQTLFMQARGELRTQLKVALRTGRARRVPRGSSRPKQARIAGMVNISERPAEAADRAISGHWEGDLIIGKGGKSQVITLVERSTRFVMLGRVNYDRRAERVALVLSAMAERMPEQLRRSITWDQGVEMAAHAKFTVASGIPVYFCDPHSPWQRGSNENTNGLLRQYLPKGTDLSCYTQQQLDDIAERLNTRPRQTLGFSTPAEKLDELLKGEPGALID
jgi:IS30 family transposase